MNFDHQGDKMAKTYNEMMEEARRTVPEVTIDEVKKGDDMEEEEMQCL